MNQSKLKFKGELLTILKENHNPLNQGKEKDASFVEAERIFMSFFEIGLFEFYHFLYTSCNSEADIEKWLISTKGEVFCLNAVNKFNEWYDAETDKSAQPVKQVLTDEQLIFWEENGYLRVSDIIPEKDCDDVVRLIDEKLGVDFKDSGTWYPKHPLLQGLMLQVYQDDSIAKIRSNQALKEVFACLYDTNRILPNTEKVSYNPPENSSFSFAGSPLHWDIDFNEGPVYYIQGLVYLNDVPANRGAFTVVPGFHHQIHSFLENRDPEMAMQELRSSGLEIPIEGKKGDVILWLQALPHAASANHSDYPRYCQYVSYTKI